MTEPNKPLEQMTAQERLDLGRSYFKEGKFDEAIKALSSIRREEADPETYAGAQLGLGLAYRTRGKLDDAITAWSNIHREDNSKAYAYAQLKLGVAYYAQDKLDEAIAAWSNIHRDDDSENYTDAQFNLGLAYHTQGKLDEAIAAWKKVREDNSKAYAYAQLNLGNAYQDQGKLDEAITAWSNIHREKADSETYAQAQFNLGLAYKNQDELDEAITAWSKIRREAAGSETYAWAQLNLGAAYYTQEDWKQAIKTWSNIRREDDSEAYARAQYGLGKIYENKGNIKQAKEAYRNVQGPLYYRAQREYRILGCPPELINDLRSLAKNTDKVRESLQIIPKFESKVAHYSRASTAFSLFGDEKNDKKPSHFRLSTIRGVNDPTEGLVLNDYWEQQGISETIHTNDTATFISCFTFNHDSLNQFRLYGKENGQEATGVSLVFNKEFFSDQSDDLKFIAGPSTDPSSKSEQIKLNDTGKPESDNKKQLIAKSALYRCIYLDPETGYWTLAQRNKSTFYRENKDKDTAENNWETYSEKISEIEKSFKDSLFDNNDSVLSKLKSIFKYPNTYGIEEKQKILETVRFILLPLQYLVKHIAFQEEQECRIMYITHLHDEKIHHDWKTQEMYVECEEHVLPHIDKIWLSPGAAKYQDFFRILLDQGSGKSKVRISQNPFRNKE